MPEPLRVYEAVAARDSGAARVAMEELIDLALADTAEALAPGKFHLKMLIFRRLAAHKFPKTGPFQAFASARPAD